MPSDRVESVPEWRPGDRWVYEWRSGSDTGVKTVDILEIKDLNGVRYYVARIGDVDHYYTLDLHWAGSVRDSKVEARMIPPHPWFVWPLEVGRRWAHRGTYEERNTGQQHQDDFAVVAAETIEVPAGRFGAFKLVRQGSHVDFDEYWFAPEVRWYVRWIGRRGEIQFEEHLREYRPAPRLIPRTGSPD